MADNQLFILLSDDDKDDCFFFEKALEELRVPAQLFAVHDGDQLMQFLTKNSDVLPHALFLDLNMPRKNGFECLTEIKQNHKLSQLPIFIFSTSFDQDIVNLLYKKGVQYYILKPPEFSQLKNVISQALSIIAKHDLIQPSKEQFVLTGNQA